MNTIQQLIQKEKERQTNGLELIASENYVSKNVLDATGSILTNKYAEGYPGKRYYGGCEVIDEIEQITIDRAKELFGAVWANVQPHSGAQANAAVMLGFLNPYDKILGFDLANGGHLTHGSPVTFSGKIYEAHFYGIHPETYLVNYDQMEAIALKQKPKLIICGASSYTRDWDYQRVRAIADQVGAIVLADISHPAGLIAKKLLNNPLDYCHIVTTTTHKTLRGPRGGLILLGKDGANLCDIRTKDGKLKRMSTILDAAVFPGIQGGPLQHVIAGKGIAFGEALTQNYEIYIRQVQKNAQLMAKTFLDFGYNVLTGGTDNHSIVLDLRNKNITGKAAEILLDSASITTNKNMVPFDNQPPMITSGLRLGTPAITSRGIMENMIPQTVEWINEVIINKDDIYKINKIKVKIKEVMSQYTIYPEI